RYQGSDPSATARLLKDGRVLVVHALLGQGGIAGGNAEARLPGGPEFGYVFHDSLPQHMRDGDAPPLSLPLQHDVVVFICGECRPLHAVMLASCITHHKSPAASTRYASPSRFTIAGGHAQWAPSTSAGVPT